MSKVDAILIKRMSERKLQISVSVDAATKQWLEDKATAVGTSSAEVARIAIAELKDKEEAESQPA